MLEQKDSVGISYYAMRLAMSRSIAEENSLKEEFKKEGIRFVVTEVGGNTSKDLQSRISHAVLGAASNVEVITKKPTEIHALMHAAEEAKRGMLLNISEANLALKIAIVRNDCWIAVGMFGVSSFTPFVGHERCGLGIMHI